MATNKLFEAAAEILAGGKGKNAMPMEKMSDPGEVDLGGPKQDVDKNKPESSLDAVYAHYKMDSTKGSKSAEAPKTKPSAASPDTQLHMKKEDAEHFDEETLNEISLKTKTKAYATRARYSYEDGQSGSDDETNTKKATKIYDNIRKKHGEAAAKRADKAAHKETFGEEFVSEEDEGIELDVTDDINALFADDSTISEEFRQKATTIFEARVTDRVQQIEEQIEERYASMLEEAVDSIKTDLEEKVNNYLSYVVEQWIEDNQIAIETGLRSELTEEFISGLRNLFAEHYIDVPAEKVDVVEELAAKNLELETKLNEEMERNIEIKRALVESRIEQITYEVTNGLTDTQVEKIKSLAESVEFSTEDEYKTKLATIRENYFPSSVKKADVEQLHEKVEDSGEKPVITDHFVAAVSQAIAKTQK